MNRMLTIKFPVVKDDRGFLSVYECGEYVPFDVQRIYTVTCSAGEVRGEHAHKKCTQLLVCLFGKIRVTMDDGSCVSRCVLEDKGTGLLLPSGIWAKQEYLSNGAILMVLCDRGYEPDDYLHTYIDFKNFVGKKDP